MSVLFGISWFVLLYLAWPRLTSIAHRLLQRRSAGKPVKLIIPPIRPSWGLVAERNLSRAAVLFLGLSVLELFLRRLQFERYTLPLFALCLILVMLLRWRRRHSYHHRDQSEIAFPKIFDDTALGLRLLKIQDLLHKLRYIAITLAHKGGSSKDLADRLQELVEKVRVFLFDIRLEPPESPLIRQARSMFVRLETLTDSFELLAHVSDEREIRKLSTGLIDILTSAKTEFEELHLAHGENLANQVNILISVLRSLYR